MSDEMYERLATPDEIEAIMRELTVLGMEMNPEGYGLKEAKPSNE